MRALLHNFLSQDCEKHIARHFDYLQELHDNVRRRSTRTLAPYVKHVRRPYYWQLNPAFNPFKVREGKKLSSYSFTLARKISAFSYRPSTALQFPITKENGSIRTLNIFPLPDAAVSRLVYKSLLHKNLTKLSNYAYAYREDRTAHHAVNEIFLEWRRLERVYVAEYDFSGFFDNIAHEYLWKILDEHGFIYTKSEKVVIQSFLNSRSARSANYPNGAKSRSKGIPQGTSISLFLANVACWELDRSLERLGVGFARYADDTVIWCEDYERVVVAYQTIEDFSRRMGVKINRAKSPGIHLLTEHGVTGEMAVKHAIDFLGYTISLNSLAIKTKKIAKIKSYIAYLIYQNLIQPLRKGIFNSNRLTTTTDLDYITALRQVRAYLYGGLNDEKLRAFVAGRIPDLQFRGAMSYYPMVNDAKQLAVLDAWMLHTFKQSLKLRQQLWFQYDGTNLPGPKPNWIEELKDLQIESDGQGGKLDFKIPSFTLINKAMQLAIKRKGISGVVKAGTEYY